MLSLSWGSQVGSITSLGREPWITWHCLGLLKVFLCACLFCHAKLFANTGFLPLALRISIFLRQRYIFIFNLYPLVPVEYISNFSDLTSDQVVNHYFILISLKQKQLFKSTLKISFFWNFLKIHKKSELVSILNETLHSSPIQKKNLPPDIF